MRARLELSGVLLVATGCVAHPHAYDEADSGLSSPHVVASSGVTASSGLAPATSSTTHSAATGSFTTSPVGTVGATTAANTTQPGPATSVDAGPLEATPDIQDPDADVPVIIPSAIATSVLPLVPESQCGNGSVELGESCDDANTEPHDGCSETCQVDPDFECLAEGALCTPTVCGDGILASMEACDDRNVVSTDGCSSDCSTVETDFACLEPGVPCISTVSCGNGETEGDEECDEGEANANTGSCTLSCTFAACGDGFLQSGEDCDDGRLSGVYGGCAAGCVRAPRCGDGTVQSSKEECDLGEGNNTGAYGGCTAQCARAPRCGDKLVQAEQGETCDDGDSIEQNGCSPTCKASSRLTTWYQFNEGSGSTVHDAVDADTVEIHLGARYSAAVPFTDAFRSGTGPQGGYVHLWRTDGVDPSRESSVDPLQFVDLNNLKPSSSAATISVWGRRTIANAAKQGLLLWMGSDGDGAGGIASTDPYNPNHELFMRADPTNADLLSMRLGFTASADYDVDAYEVPKPASTPPDATSCQFVAKVPFGAWHHYVMVITNLQNPAGAHIIDPVANLTAYVDGVQLGQETCHSVNLSRFREAFIGRSEFAQNADSSWLGDVDNFMLFSRAFTTQEVIELYQSQIP